MLFILAGLLSLSSCRDDRISRYDRLINRTDKIIIIRNKTKDSLVIATSPLPDKIKEVLKRHIYPVAPKQFLAERSVSLYSKDRKTGVILLTYGKAPYINVCSDSLNFAVRMTYDIGMMLDHIPIENNH